MLACYLVNFSIVPPSDVEKHLYSKIKPEFKVNLATGSVFRD